MLTFIKGTSGTNRTDILHKKILELLKLEKNVILIVPEQFSFETEKSLLLELGEALFSKIKVTSFSFMAANILKSHGKYSKPRLDNNGKLIFINLVLKKLKNQLKFFQSSKKFTNISKPLINFISSLKQYNINTKELNKFCNKTQNNELKLKLSAIIKIVDEYNNIISASYADPDDDLDILEDILNEENIFEDSVVFFDSFVSFSNKEFKIVKHILSQAKDIYFSICCDNLQSFDNFDIFYPVKKTINLIKNNYNQETKEIYLENHSRFLNDELKFLEKNIFRNNKEVYSKQTKNINLYKARNIYEECEFIARKIKQLINTGNYNYSDFTVIFRQVEDYDGIIQNIFKQYDIPYFLDAPKRIDSKPLMNLILLAFDIIHNNYKQDDIVNYLKTGLVGVNIEDISTLENYAFMWNLNSSDWLADFNEHPRGFEGDFTKDDLKILKKLNDIRKKVINPIKNFDQKIKDATGKEIAKAIFEFLEEINIKENLKLYSKNLYENKEYSLCDEQLRLWKILINILEQMATALNKIKINSKLFAEILKKIFESENISFIPKGVDEVTIGNIGRMRPANPKVTFLIGAIDDKFPQVEIKNSLFTQNDIYELKKNNIKFFEDIDDINSSELLLAYFAVTSPCEKLFISYYQQSIDGKECFPCVILSEINKIFKKANIEFEEILNITDLIWSKQAAFNMLAAARTKNKALYENLKEVLNRDEFYKEKIKKLENLNTGDFNFKNIENLNNLIGNNIKISASQIEKYYLCPFAYFCRYVLKAKPIKQAKLDPIEYGNTVHFILEKMLYKFDIDKLVCLSYEEIKQNVKCILNEYIIRFGNVKRLSERFKFLLLKCTHSACTLIKYIASELKSSGFKAKEFEFSIKNNLEKPFKIQLKDKSFVEINGYIDRIDILEKNSTRYLRIVDYKTGSKEFKLSDIIHGLNMQMLIYLDALLKSNKYKNAKPAGVLYMPADVKANIANKHLSKEAAEKLNKNNFKMSGLIANDELIYENIKDSVKKTSFISNANLNLTPFETIIKILDQVETKIKEMAENLKQGKVAADPALTVKNACEFCDYACICNFENKNNCKSEENYSNEQALEILLKENKQNEQN